MADLLHSTSNVVLHVRRLDTDEKKEPGIDRAHDDTTYLDGAHVTRCTTIRTGGDCGSPIEWCRG